MTDTPILEQLSENLQRELTSSIGGYHFWYAVIGNPIVSEGVYHRLCIYVWDGYGRWPSHEAINDR